MPVCPKDLRQNLAYRKKILELGNSSKSAREEIQIACSRDPQWFKSTFLWTFDAQNYPDSPERPLIQYHHQETASVRLLKSIGKHGLIFPKTRRMGVTTSILADFFWRWRFRPMQSFLLLSSKEDKVDKQGDPSSLMWKLDHYNNCLPAWLRVEVDRAKLRFGNPENGSIINGESTNADADRGGVRTAVLADEVAAMPNGEQVMDAVGPLTESLYLVSTPQGAFGSFYKKYREWFAVRPEWVVILHWTMHEVFSRGIYWTEEPITGYREPWWKGKPRSPWYDKECLKLSGAKRIAQELDIAFNEAGGQYYEPDLIERLLKETARNPVVCGEMRYNEAGEEQQFVPGPHGRLRLWCHVVEGLPPKGEYVAGADIATGKGGEMSSQSTLSIVNKNTGEKVAEFRFNRITPTNFARYAVAVCRWFYDAKLIWGSQGPGSDFGVTVKRECRYGKVYTRPGDSGKTGFVETPEAKLAIHGDYSDALHQGRFVNRSKEALEECRQFIYSPTGSVEHSQAIQADQDPENKGKLHGDIVVADALANQLLPLRKPGEVKVYLEPPRNSFAWRLRENERLAKTQDEWGLVDTNW